MSETSEDNKLTKEQKQVLAKVGLVLWRQDKGDAVPEGQEARKAAYALEKADYRKKARQLVRQLNRRGLELTAIAGADEADEE